MDKTEAQLATLEWEMGRLCAMRTDRLATARAMIDRANRYYDDAAIPLARQISKLRAQLEAEKLAKKPVTPVHSPSDSHDPEWSQQDIDHFYELRNRGDKTRD